MKPCILFLVTGLLVTNAFSRSDDLRIEYLLLGGESFVRDVIKVAPHSKTAPLFIGSCELNGKKSKDILPQISLYSCGFVVTQSCGFPTCSHAAARG